MVAANVLIKRRPDIRLSIPRVVAPGRPFPVRVHLDCPKPVRIGGVEVRVFGRYCTIRPSQYGEQRHETRFYRSVVRPIEGPTDLRAGEHVLGAHLVLPADAPSTYRGSRIVVEHIVEVVVDIPWWPDARASFALQVVNPGLGAGNGERRVWASDPDGPRARDPYAEFSLSTTELVPGGHVTAVVAVSNVELNRYRQVQVTLVAFERIRRLLTTKHALAWARWRLGLDGPAENEPIPFRLVVPSTVVPSFSVGHVSVDWFVEFEVAVAFGRDIKGWIPVSIRRPEAGDDETAVAPPAVGSARLELLWETVAGNTGCEPEGTTMRTTVGSVSVDVRREHRGRDGVYVVGELRYPDLGIGLALDGSAANRRLLARDDQQLAWLRERIDAIAEDAPVAVADDDHVVVEIANAGTQARHLESFVRGALAMANVLDAARDQLPAPAKMRDVVDHWRDAARRLGAGFDCAAMCVWLIRDTDRLEMRPRWSATGDARGIVLTLWPGARIDHRYHVRWEEADGLIADAHGVSDLLTDADAGAIDDERVVIERPSLDVDAAIGTAVAMLRFAERLAGRRGAYR